MTGVPVDDILTRETAELQKHALSFREHSLEYVLEVSSLGDELSKWGTVPDRAQTLIPQLSNFLVTVNEVREENDGCFLPLEFTCSA